MSLTRFNDDPARMQKQIEESIYAGNYALSTPGQGTALPFVEDPYIRLQGWGANLMTNARDIEARLWGVDGKLSRHYALGDDSAAVGSSTLPLLDTQRREYTSVAPFVEQSRASCPAWMFKDQDHTRWETPFLNPQANLEIPFFNNVQTRIIEKDSYFAQLPDSSIIIAPMGGGYAAASRE